MGAEEIVLIVGAILVRWAASGMLARLLGVTLFKKPSTSSSQ
jgi:hypothetical protein